MFKIIEDQFNNNINLTNTMFEFVIKSYNSDIDYVRKMTESVNDYRIEDLLYTEASGNFTTKIKDIFNKIIEAIKKFTIDTKRAIKTKIMQMKIKKVINNISKEITKPIDQLISSYEDSIITLTSIVNKIQRTNDIEKIEKLSNDIQTIQKKHEKFIVQKVDLCSRTVRATSEKMVKKINKKSSEEFGEKYIYNCIDRISDIQQEEIHKLEEIANKISINDSYSPKEKI